MRFVSIPVRNLRRRPVRTISSALSVTIAFASFIGLVGVSRGMGQAWSQELHGRGVDLMASSRGAWMLITSSMDERLGDNLRKIPGVRAVAGALWDLAAAESGRPMLVEAWATDSFLWQALKLKSGRLPNPGEANGVLIGEGAAELLGKKAGDPVRLYGKPFAITGIYVSNGVMASFSIVMPLPSLQNVLARQGKVTGFNMQLERTDSASVAEVRSRLGAAFPSLLFTESKDLAEHDDSMRMLRAAAWVTSAIALVMALVVILNTLLLSITERTREIGILSALGWSSQRILTMIVLEGVMLAVAGSVAGAVLGVAGMRWLTTVPQVRGFIVPVISWSLLLEAALAALVLGALGSIYPATRALSLKPIEALRYE
jgi:putative ABC transport system permease protein